MLYTNYYHLPDLDSTWTTFWIQIWMLLDDLDFVLRKLKCFKETHKETILIFIGTVDKIYINNRNTGFWIRLLEGLATHFDSQFCLKMPLATYEYFMELSVKQLSDYLSVCSLSTSGKKVELLARAFAAMELKSDIIKSTKSQEIKLQAQYENKLSEQEIPDPKLIAKLKWIDDLTKWPYTTLENIIFSYILKKRDFDADNTGRYKDQKAFFTLIVAL